MIFSPLPTISLFANHHLQTKKSFRLGPPFTFSHICLGKKIEVLVSEYICEINMRKCRTDLLCDQPIFVTQSVAQQILPSW